jgi:hypothetical protein
MSSPYPRESNEEYSKSSPLISLLQSSMDERRNADARFSNYYGGNPPGQVASSQPQQQRQPNLNTLKRAKDMYNMYDAYKVMGGNGIGGGQAAPAFMGEGAGFSGAESIGG